MYPMGMWNVFLWCRWIYRLLYILIFHPNEWTIYSMLLLLLGHPPVLTALKRLTVIFHKNNLCTIEIQCHVSPHKQKQGEKSIIILKYDWLKRALPGLHNTLFAQWLQRNKQSSCLVGFFSLISLSCPFNIHPFPNTFRCPEAPSSPCRTQNKMLKISI